MFVRMSNIYKHGIRLVEALDSIVDFQQGRRAILYGSCHQELKLGATLGPSSTRNELALRFGKRSSWWGDLLSYEKTENRWESVGLQGGSGYNSRLYDQENSTEI